jgi:hypothetical protein
MVKRGEERMHELEIMLQGEKFIANEMCKYFPNKDINE